MQIKNLKSNKRTVLNSSTETTAPARPFLVWLFLNEEIETFIMVKNNDLSADIDNTVTQGKNKKHKGFRARFENAAAAITRATGSSAAFMIAITIILIWGVMGPIFKYSDTWQLVINTGTTIITFLMVFIIQQSQNKDSLAIQLKLNELIAAEERASNRLIDVEDLTQDELEVLKKFYIRLSKLAEKENDLFSSHSIDEATGQHKHKIGIRKAPAKNKS